METRLERDSMGEMAVPGDALYGAQTARALANFAISGRGIGREMIRALGRVKLVAISGASNVTGCLNPIHRLAEKAHAAGAMTVVSADLLALVLLRPPGEFGADVVVGNSQRFGVPLGYGGPHAAFMATQEAYKRQMPGRLIGVSVDSTGAPALRTAGVLPLLLPPFREWRRITAWPLLLMAAFTAIGLLTVWGSQTSAAAMALCRAWAQLSK